MGRNVIILGLVLLVSCAPLNTPQPASPSAAATRPAALADNYPSLTPTLHPTLTLSPLQATVQAAIDSCGPGYPYNSQEARMLSGDGGWIAVVCQDNGLYTKVFSMDGNTSWILPTIPDASVSEAPGYYYEPYVWSKDGKYLFLRPACLCYPDGPFLAFVDGWGLSRLDLQSGSLDVWFPADTAGYAFALSGDQRWIAFTEHVKDGNSLVHVREIETGAEQVIAIPQEYSSIGNFAWSRDNSQLIIVAGLGGWWDHIAGISVFSYDLGPRRLVTLVEHDGRQLFPISGYDYETRIGSPWLSENMLLVGDPLYGGPAWTLNTKTGEVTDYATPVVAPTYNP